MSELDVGEDGAHADTSGAAEGVATIARERPEGDAARRGLRSVVTGRSFLAVLAVLGLVGTIGFGLAWNGERNHDAQASAAKAAGRDFLIALTNFDGKTIDTDFDRIVSYATGAFGQQADQFFGSDVRKALRERQASSRGEIQSLYLQSYAGGRARIFAVVDQTIANNQFPAPQSDELRVEVGLTHLSKGWRVYDVRVLQAPNAGGGAAATPGAAPTTSVPK
jgi:hypothetical protein